VTRLLEEVVYRPGMTFAEIARAVDAPKSSVHAFIAGLLHVGWLYEVDRRFYLGPAVYGLTLASGQIRAGLVSQRALDDLSAETGAGVFLGVQAGDHLIYIAVAGTDPVVGFNARTNIRRDLLTTAGGKVLLASRPDGDREAYLRRRSAGEPELVEAFLDEYEAIRATGIATNLWASGTRFAIASNLHKAPGEAVASVTLIGPAAEFRPRLEELSARLRDRLAAWERSGGAD
jgi:DNA-binding IclR family transcriptional regulator